MDEYFKCVDGYGYIHPSLVCDGHDHCEDGSDEVQTECSCPRDDVAVINGQKVVILPEYRKDLRHLKTTAILKVLSFSCFYFYFVLF